MPPTRGCWVSPPRGRNFDIFHSRHLVIIKMQAARVGNDDVADGSSSHRSVSGMHAVVSAARCR
jgi:hypothetical protein